MRALPRGRAAARASRRARLQASGSSPSPGSSECIVVSMPHSTAGGSRVRIDAQPRARRHGDRRVAGRAGTGLSDEAGPPDRALPGGRRDGLLRAHGVHEDVGVARAAGGGRKSPRRRHGDRGKRGGKQRADIVMTPIPYKGGADAMTDLIGGRISAMFPDIASALPQIRGGKLRALAVASDKRVAALPELPTIGESGYPGFEAWAWQGFVAPAGTPRTVVMKLNAEFARVMADPAIRQRLSESGFEPRTSTPEEFGAYLKSEIAKWAQVIRDSRISLD